MQWHVEVDDDHNQGRQNKSKRAHAQSGNVSPQSCVVRRRG
jgi:hypothetical protein